MRYAFYSHGGCENHGCEAIVRTLSAMIKEACPESTIKLYTLDAQSDKSGDLPNIDESEEFNYIRPVLKTTTAQKIKLSLLSRKSQKLADEYFYSLSCRNSSLKKNDIYISVGGDNYCYGDGHAAVAINRELKKLGKKTVLWGCSIGEDNLTDDKIKDLKTFDLIVTRETLTFETLKNHGIDKNTVLYPDPAFTLDVDENAAELFEIKEGSIGFNISTMVENLSDSVDTFEKTCADFIKELLNRTDKNIVLIPHVTRKIWGDLEPLQFLANYFRDNNRVQLIPSTLTAAQYKSIISRCDMFIGARTHATIAAYSTCVPTLVIGYSVKSRGIAKDIFGTDEGLVIPVSEITDVKKMIQAYEDFLKKKESYRKHLEEFMPSYIERAKSSINELLNI